ncbi:hypothetical protein SISSUDRAFT_297930 [Sistotremastrum suecicum HHB10207 ss-3]|uniref:Uncharacterized protein n=1 Tax=Sistotremastrum suecicum HHB10207 ss-3 TaxID=1314776 RepID=A0A165ZFF4_9AGAM|nr:hypothetical protein SISSUDRAFT_297930 [Sistotremastrum suecicum HHB10207 ss-3]
MIERKKEFMSASSFDRFQCSCNRSILLLLLLQQQQQQQNKNVQIESYPEQSPPHVLSTSYSQLQINSLQLCSNLKVESDRPSQTLHSSTQPLPLLHLNSPLNSPLKLSIIATCPYVNSHHHPHPVVPIPCSFVAHRESSTGLCSLLFRGGGRGERRMQRDPRKKFSGRERSTGSRYMSTW